tara:strand:- start:34 stop:204 length:171 start_codon:yes stop_codon:yes gene_type:complete
MNITSAKYNQYLGENCSLTVVTEDGRIMRVPIDTANADYQAVLEWVADGNTIADAD